MSFITSFIATLLIGGIAGWMAGLIRKGQGFGIFTNIIIGIIGGFIGQLILLPFGIDTNADGNFLWSILVATLGAVVLLAIINFFKKGN